MQGKINFIAKTQIINQASSPFQTVNDGSRFISDYIPIHNGAKIIWIFGTANPSTTTLFGIFDSAKNYLTSFLASGTNGQRSFTVDRENAAFAVGTFVNEDGYTPSIYVDGVLAWKKKDIAGVVPTLTDYINGRVPGIDAVPTKNSTNIVRSGGVFDALDTLSKTVNGQQSNFAKGNINQNGGVTSSTISIYTIDYIPCTAGTSIKWYFHTAVTTAYLVFYDSEKVKVEGQAWSNRGVNTSPRTLTVPVGAVYLRASFEPTDVNNPDPAEVYLAVGSTKIWEPIVKVEGHEDKISTLQESVADILEQLAGDEGEVESKLGLIVGKDDAVHITEDGVFAKETTGIKLNPTAILEGFYETQPRILAENKRFSGTKANYTDTLNGCCVTKVYKLKEDATSFRWMFANPNNLSFGGNDLIGWLKDGVYQSYNSATINAQGVTTTKGINRNAIKTNGVVVEVNEVMATLTMAGVDDSYMFDNTGYIYFAGKNTIYYGHHYTTDIEEQESIDYGVIGNTYPEEAEYIKKHLTDGEVTYSGSTVSKIKGITNRFIFCHVSDMHGGFPANLGEFVDKTEANFLAMTGDNVADKYADSFTATANGIKAMTKPCFITTGNHDASGAPSIQDLFTKEFAPIKEHIGLPELETTYYSVDYPFDDQCDYTDKNGGQDLTNCSGFKCIFLDNYDGMSSYTSMPSEKNAVMSSTQINWLFTQLQDAIDNKLAVLIFMHHRPCAVDGKAERWFDNTLANERGYDNGTQLKFIADIIDAFKKVSSVTFTHGGVEYTRAFSKPNGVVRGLFVGYFTGHTHYDCVGYLADYPNQLNVSVARYDGNTAAASCINRYTDNAITFNYCVVDKKCGTITIYRVGCQDTFSGYKRDLFVGKWL